LTRKNGASVLSLAGWYRVRARNEHCRATTTNRLNDHTKMRLYSHPQQAILYNIVV
jgi:hypothetical protein